MNKSTYIKTLDLQKHGVQFTVNANQNEALSRQLIINITDCGKPFDFGNGELTAVLFATKSDNTVLYNACEVDNSTVSYTLTQQTLTSPGEVRARLLIVAIDNIEDALDAIENNALGESETVQVLYSPEFCIIVDEVEAYDGAIESTDEYTALTQASATALAAATAANTAASSASEAAGNISASVTQSAFGATITVTDANGTTTTANITNGAKGDSGAVGATGAKGADGYSPTVTVTPIQNGYQITITDEQGEHTFNLYNGESGTTYTMGATMDDTGNVLNVKSGYIESQTGRKPLDLSAFDGTGADKFKDLSTLSTGSYDVVKGGYICANPLGSSPQSRQSDVMEGSVLTLDSNGYCTFTDTYGIINLVDVAGRSIADWNQADLQTEIDVDDKLSGYETSQHASSTYQPKNRYITDTNVPVSAWNEEATPTYADYPYKATISIQGVDTNTWAYIVWGADIPEVYPDCKTVQGGIEIFASEPVAITIPTIKIER